MVDISEKIDDRVIADGAGAGRIAGVAPARAAVTQITTATTVPITINAPDEVDILPNGSVNVAPGPAVTITATAGGMKASATLTVTP